MANGPPTPPPTTEIELQDEARGNLSSELTATVLPTGAGEDLYQNTFPNIANLASQSNYQSLIQTAENSELNSNAESDHRTTRLLITAPLVLAYLIVDDLPPARYALTRLPDNLLSTPLLKSLIGLVSSTSERKYVDVYSRAEGLYNLVHQPDFFDQSLASVLTGLIAVFIESFRQRTFILLSKAYTSLPLSLAQTYLGLKADQLISAAEDNQWSYDPPNNTFSPQRSPTISNTDKNTFSSLSTFHFVADSVAKLEL